LFNNRVSWALLAFAVVGAPFPFGSTDLSAIAFWCIILGIALIVCGIRSLRPIHFGFLFLSAAIVFVLGFVLHEQLALYPWVAPFHPIWAESEKALSESVQASVSITRNQPWLSIGGPLLAVLTLTISFVVGTDRTLAWRLFWIFAWAGVAYALFSIATYLLEPTKVLWREKTSYLNALTGTFINRNTAAVFFGSCSVVWLLIGLEKIRELLPRDDDYPWGRLLSDILNNITLRIATPFGMLILCLAAMFLTQSRAGVVLSLAALLIAFTCSYRRMLRSRTGVWTVVLIAGAVLLMLLQIMGAGVSSRFDFEGVVDGGRLATYRSTLKMIGDEPWFGTGLGTFEAAYPAYRSAEISMWGIWNRAHNTLLEITSDLGIPAAATVTVGWFFIARQLILGVLGRRRDLSLPIAGLAIAFIGLMHSLVDFSLQIAGFAIPFYSMIGIGLAQSFSTRDRAI
jgi:O-antigen ligase